MFPVITPMWKIWTKQTLFHLFSIKKSQGQTMTLMCTIQNGLQTPEKQTKSNGLYNKITNMLAQKCFLFIVSINTPYDLAGL